MQRRLLTMTFISMVFLGVGCNQPGTVLVKYDGDGTPRVSETPSRGQYALYVKNAQDPQVVYPLMKGDTLGFEKTDGKVGSVAGKHKDEIKQDRTYYWRMLEE